MIGFDDDKLDEEELVDEAIWTAANEPEKFNTTDMGNAARLVAQHGRNLRYCEALGGWLVWDGRRWKPDTTGEVWRLAKATVRTIYHEAANAIDTARRKDLAKHAAASEAHHRLRAMIELATTEPEIPVTPDRLDHGPWLFNAANGTVDLRTGELRAHERADLLTRIAPAAYDAGATAPQWMSFLDTVMARTELVAFLQRAVGYTLTGVTTEQVLVMLHGTGANGKSTFLEAMRAMLGDYAQQTPSETLLAKRPGAVPNDVARLKGARFVAAVETDDGRRLAEGLVKRLTGGDTIAARFLFREFFEFVPEFKLWLATNHRPRITGTDHAIWRRILLVPFTVTVPEANQDRALSGKLASEGDGILAWAVAGCLAWQREGLSVPDEVRAATTGYRVDQDVLAEFLEECTVASATASVGKGDLYTAYVEWAKASGEDGTLTKKGLGMRLAERGFDEVRDASKRTWIGIGLRSVTHDRS